LNFFHISCPHRSHFEYFPVRFLIETDQKRPALAHCRRPQISGRAEYKFAQSRLVNLLLSKIDLYRLLTLAGIDNIDAGEKPAGIALFQNGLVGNDLLGDVDFMLCKKLLRPGRGLSARPMVMPINFRHRFFPHLCRSVHAPETYIKRIRAIIMGKIGLN
jgi:hypothetical protein